MPLGPGALTTWPFSKRAPMWDEIYEVGRGDRAPTGGGDEKINSRDDDWARSIAFGDLDASPAHHAAGCASWPIG